MKRDSFIQPHQSHCDSHVESYPDSTRFLCGHLCLCLCLFVCVCVSEYFLGSHPSSTVHRDTHTPVPVQSRGSMCVKGCARDGCTEEERKKNG